MDICEFCKKEFSNKYTLHTHQIKSKKCIANRDKPVIDNSYICIDGCEQIFNGKFILERHQKTCIKYNEKKIIKIEKEVQNEKLLCFTKNKQLEEENLNLKILNKNYESKIQYLEKQLEKMNSIFESSLKESINKPTVTNNTYNKAVIEINNENEEKENEEKYKLQPLNLGNDLYIENREEDGYINVTNLCKAGNKQFKHWNSIEKTKAFLRVLSSEVGIPTSLLIIHQTGSGSNQCTWVHPYIAINIAQWISPQFDVKVSSWIYEVMLTGKIDISKTKSFQQLRLENKEHKLKIQYLTKKYVKAQPRVQYNEKNVIYVLTTPSHKKERKYILGKATNLTSRLSTYNKTDEHEVIYYQECTDEDSMSIVEQLIFHKLKDYREQANRERFILPEGKTIELFIDVIKKSIDNL